MKNERLKRISFLLVLTVALYKYVNFEYAALYLLATIAVDLSFINKE
ncbi:hypothetical protein [Enterococcus wangshanyuanii]|nr:hypothetical protein [Enterococcus wangshanyuanii]